MWQYILWKVTARMKSNDACKILRIMSGTYKNSKILVRRTRKGLIKHYGGRTGDMDLTFSAVGENTSFFVLECAGEPTPVLAGPWRETEPLWWVGSPLIPHGFSSALMSFQRQDPVAALSEDPHSPLISLTKPLDEEHLLSFPLAYESFNKKVCIGAPCMQFSTYNHLNGLSLAFL